MTPKTKNIAQQHDLESSGMLPLLGVMRSEDCNDG